MSIYNRHSNRISYLHETLDNEYNKDKLKKIYDLYLPDFFLRFETELIRIGVSDLSGKAFRKHELIDIFANIFKDKTLCNAFLSFMPHAVRKIFTILTWEGIQEVGVLEKRLKCTITRKRYSPEYLFFQFYSNSSYYSTNESNAQIYLPEGIIEKLRCCIPRPAEYNIIPLDKIETTAFVYNNETTALTELELTLNFIKQGYLKFSQNGKPLAGSIKQLSQLTDSVDFYEKSEEKEFKFLKIRLMVSLLRALSPSAVSLNSQPHKLSKEIFSSFTDCKYSFIDNVCSHLRANDKKWLFDDEKNIMDKIVTILKEFPPGKWVSVENLIIYIFLREINFFEPIIIYRFYIFVETDSRYNDKTKLYLDEHLINPLAANPLIKGILFLLTAFGWLEIAYDLPENKGIKVAKKSYLTVFDGIKYVRLTKLGEFVFGLSEIYQPPADSKKESTITLDQNRLILTINGNDKLKKMIVEDMMEKINGSCYKMTFDSLLKRCSSKEDIKTKIATFENSISPDIPKIWKFFFKGVLDRIDPLTVQKDLIVYKLGEDKNLLHLFATDSILKKYALRTEDFHITIAKNNMDKVKKRLESFGYLITK